MRPLLLAVLLAGCAKAKPEPSPSPPSASEKITYTEVEARLPEFLQNGFVHSVTAAGGQLSQGDGLFFTGLATYGADCATGAPLAAALEKMLTDMDGAVYRDPTLPGQSILDGALGLYRGIAGRVRACGEQEVWAPLVAKHLAYMAAHGDTLNADGARLDGGFDYVRDFLAWKLGVGPEPAYARQQALEDLVVNTWVAADIAAHASCYRTHLVLIALQTVEALGGTVTATARNGLCAATIGVGMPTVDHWCGRQSLQPWLDAFAYDVWDFRHQRCSAWESPDGNGVARPAVDYLVGYRDEAGE